VLWIFVLFLNILQMCSHKSTEYRPFVHEVSFAVTDLGYIHMVNSFPASPPFPIPISNNAKREPQPKLLNQATPSSAYILP
jgi:hypothetical protein